MRVLLVGSLSERAQLRTRANGSLDVAGEFDSLAAARASAIDSDAILMPNGVRRGSDLHPDPGLTPGGYDEPLTPREVQVLELLAEGLANKAIATRLHISDQTVKFHVSAISSKLGAHNRTDTVRRAVRRGLITL